MTAMRFSLLPVSIFVPPLTLAARGEMKTVNFYSYLGAAQSIVFRQPRRRSPRRYHSARERRRWTMKRVIFPCLVLLFAFVAAPGAARAQTETATGVGNEEELALVRARLRAGEKEET